MYTYIYILYEHTHKHIDFYIHMYKFMYTYINTYRSTFYKWVKFIGLHTSLVLFQQCSTDRGP